MENIKLTITQAKREETIDNILNLIVTDFEGIEVTATFAKKLLEESIQVLEEKSLNTNLKNLI